MFKPRNVFLFIFLITPAVLKATKVSIKMIGGTVKAPMYDT